MLDTEPSDFTGGARWVLEEKDAGFRLACPGGVFVGMTDKKALKVLKLIANSLKLIAFVSSANERKESKHNDRQQTKQTGSNKTQSPASCGIYPRDEAEKRNNERCAVQICKTVHGRSKKRTAADSAAERAKKNIVIFAKKNV